MQAENWKKVKEILQLESAEREAFLAGANLSAEVRAEVESLIAQEENAKDFMSLSAADFSVDFFESENGSETLVGQKVGIYEVIKELGFGGMGAVYLAARADGKFEQKVAIKMLKREFNVEKIRRNFTREKEIQSKLDHPNIARLLDAGTTADGVPYLVMEYIEGLAIDKFCRENSLTLNERLKLFNKVCDAVAFAHRNLIVHRDLKPSNILVTENGEPKLLDFGISKLIDEKSEDAHTITNLGAMTPEYASPEQIKGESVTTATDIYSLGVVLYKVLTDSHPFELGGKTTGEVLEIITKNAPVTPSRVNAEGGDRQSAIRNPKLTGDLDNIILKSLRKEPERRYQTIEQFADDIWRFIDGLPVLARRATFSYQASKFYRRNKIGVSAAILVLISLIAGIAVAIWQANAARVQAQLATNARNAAELETQKVKSEKEKAEKISKFMAKIISYANPKWYSEGAKFGKDARVIDAIVDLGEKIDVEFAGEPEVAAELHHKFTEVVLANPGGLSAGEKLERQLFHARRALELRKQFYGERHELVAKDMVYFYWAGGVAKSEKPKYLMEAIQMMRETNPHNLNLPYMLEDYTARLILPNYEDIHEEFLRAVIPPTGENRYQVAERYLLEALPIFREHYKIDNSAVISNECKLAYAQIKQNKIAEAETHYRICKESGNKLQPIYVPGFLPLVEEALEANNR